MVVGHSGCPLLLHDWLYTFHMPFFFFISGYLFNLTSLNAFLPFCRRKIRSLWWPFVKWNVLFILLHNFCYKINFLYDKYSCVDIYKKIMFSLVMGEPELLLGPFWFFQQLIRVNIIAWMILRICKYSSPNISHRLISGVIIFLIVLSLGAYYIDLRVPGVLSKLTVISLLFYVCGYALRAFESKIHSYVYNIYIYIYAIVLTIGGAVYNPAELMTVSFTGMLPYWLVGLFGCIAVLGLSKNIANKASYFAIIIDYLGKHTVALMVWHLISFKFLSLLLVKTLAFSSDILLSWPVPSIASDGYWILYSVVGIIIPLVIENVFTRLTAIFAKLRREHYSIHIES